MHALLAILAACSDPSTGGKTTVTATSTITTATTSSTGTTATTGSTTGGTTATTASTTGTTLTEDLRLAPSWMRVDVGATYALRTVLDVGGEPQEVQPTFEVDDPSVATVDGDGLVTALSVGTTRIVARWKGSYGEATVEVQDTGELGVTVLSAGDLLPVEDASVAQDDQVVKVDPATGRGVLQVAPAEPVHVTVYSPSRDDLVQLTAMDVVGREIVLVMDRVEPDPPPAEVSGTVDFRWMPPLTDDEKAAGMFLMGIAVPSLQAGPLFLDANALLAPDRKVDLYGLEGLVPGNVYAQDLVEDWQAQATTGTFGMWTMAGAVPLADALTGFSSLDSALDFLLTYMEGFSFGWVGGLELSEGGLGGVVLEPSEPLTDSVTVEVPPLPAGFEGDEEVLLVALDGDGPEGPAVVGMGKSGPGTVSFPRVPGEAAGLVGDDRVLLYAEVGGLGASGVRVLALADVVDGVAEPVELLGPARVVSFNGATHDYEFLVPEGADWARVRMTGKNGTMRDLLLPPGEHVGELPDDGLQVGYGNVTFELVALQLAEGGYQDALVRGLTRVDDLRGLTTATAWATQQVVTEP